MLKLKGMIFKMLDHHEQIRHLKFLVDHHKDLSCLGDTTVQVWDETKDFDPSKVKTVSDVPNKWFWDFIKLITGQGISEEDQKTRTRAANGPWCTSSAISQATFSDSSELEVFLSGVKGISMLIIISDSHYHNDDVSLI